jgi:hypothetical protein
VRTFSHERDPRRRVGPFRPPALALNRHHEGDDRADDQHDERDQPEDLPEAVRPLSGHLPGAPVDEDLEQLLAVAVVRDPHRQQAVLERDAEVSRVGHLDPLVVASDVPADQVVDRGLHHLLRDLQPLLQVHRVPLRLQSREERVLKRFEFAGVPRFEAVDQVRRDAFRTAHEDVVEEMLNLAGDGVPVRFRHGA